MRRFSGLRRSKRTTSSPRALPAEIQLVSFRMASPSRAAASLDAEELRAVLRDALGGPDLGWNGPLIDGLLQQASRSRSGWRPQAPGGSFRKDLERFLQKGRNGADVDPEEAAAFLRKARQAFFAGQYDLAREAFEPLLDSIGSAELEMGFHELPDEVLTVDLSECARLFLVSVYLSSPRRDRARDVREALARFVFAGTPPAPAFRRAQRQSHPQAIRRRCAARRAAIRATPARFSPFC